MKINSFLEEKERSYERKWGKVVQIAATPAT